MSGPFDIIYEDPPWQFRNWSMGQREARGEKWGRAKGRSPYNCLTNDDLCALPIDRIAAKDCARFTWATFPKLVEALAYIHAPKNAKTGKPVFEYKSVAFVWLKTTPNAASSLLKRRQQLAGIDQDQDMVTSHLMDWVKGERANSVPGLWHFGSGYWTHANVEVCLLSTRGKAASWRIDRGISQLVIEPVGAHSSKPAGVRDRIVRLVGDRPRIELFARAPNVGKGWESTGLECDGVDIGDYLEIHGER